MRCCSERNGFEKEEDERLWLNWMEFPETVLTKSKTGKLEVRILDSSGSYVICKYLDPKSMKSAANTKARPKGPERKCTGVFHHTAKGL